MTIKVSKKIIVCIILVLTVGLFVTFVGGLFFSVPKVLDIAFETFEQMNHPLPTPPKQHFGYFPYEVIYKVDGETITVKKRVEIEYNGYYKYYGDYSNYWSSYGNAPNITLYHGADEDGVVGLTMYCGSNEYYMGLESSDMIVNTNRWKAGDIILSCEKYPWKVISYEEAYREYGVEIIKAEFSEPLS